MSSNEIKISADSRSEFGKGASRRLRREGKVPAVIYGHRTDPVHIALPGHESLLALRTANALLSITIDGGTSQLALPKQVQRHPLTGFLEHVDLLIVMKGEKVTVEVPVVVLGEEKLVEGMVMSDMQTVTLEVEATNIPAQVEVDVTGFEVGQQLTIGEVTLPEGAVYPGEPEDLVLTVNVARVGEEPDEGEEAVEGGAVEGAEDEGTEDDQE
ncbi:MAG TPA: 50S ribosomal protein L25/general stress protein Ctc [Propionibacterium sp.]|nr:50S ribosomal protein L25/general stress protein Ctc [Propionibacterium sp.]